MGWARSDRGTRRLEHRAAPDDISRALRPCDRKGGSPLHNGLPGCSDGRRSTGSRVLPGVLATLQV
jgi:hypothetical protein